MLHHGRLSMHLTLNVLSQTALCFHRVFCESTVLCDSGIVTAGSMQVLLCKQHETPRDAQYTCRAFWSCDSTTG